MQAVAPSTGKRQRGSSKVKPGETPDAAGGRGQGKAPRPSPRPFNVARAQPDRLRDAAHAGYTVRIGRDMVMGGGFQWCGASRRRIAV